MEKINQHSLQCFSFCVPLEAWRRGNYDRINFPFNFTFLWESLVMPSSSLGQYKQEQPLLLHFQFLAVFYPFCLNTFFSPQICLLFLWSSSLDGGGLETRCHNPFITLNISPLALSCSLAPSLSSLSPPAFLCSSPSLYVS